MRVLGLVQGLVFGVLCMMFALVSGASDTSAEEDLRNLYLDAKPVLDVRYRFEHVDQDSASKNAKAHS